MGLKFRKHDNLCMIADCLGLQEYQPIVVCFPYGVPGEPPIVMDIPVKVCRLHRTPELRAMVMSQDNWDVLTEVLLTKGMPEPDPKRTGVEFRRLPPKDVHTNIVVGPARKE